MERQKEQGSALILTMVVTIILLFLGSSLGLLSMVESRMSLREEQNMQAYYLARSGADALAQYIIDNPAELDALRNKTSNSIYALNPESEDKYFIVKIEDYSDGGSRIKSIGVVGDQERVVYLTVETTSPPPPTFTNAIVALGTGHPAFKLTGGATIEGDIVTNTVREDSIYLEGGAKIKGGVSVGPKGEPTTVINNLELVDNGGKALKALDDPVTYPNLVFPLLPEGLDRHDTTPVEGENYVIRENGQWDRIKSSSNCTLKIDLNYGIDGPRIIRVRSLEIGGPIKLINVGEDGRLLLFVEEKLIVHDGDAHINWPGEGGSRPQVFTLYYAGRDEILNAQFKMTGNIVSKTANLFFGHGVSLNGNVFAAGSEHSTVKILGGAGVEPSLVYAPNSTVILAEGGTLSGSVVSHKFEASGGTLTKFCDIDMTTLPEGIFSGSSAGVIGSAYKRGVWGTD